VQFLVLKALYKHISTGMYLAMLQSMYETINTQVYTNVYSQVLIHTAD